MNVNQNDLRSGVTEGMKYITELDHLVHDRLRVEFYRSHAVAQGASAEISR